MEYQNQPNLLLEALAYLGRKANGNSWQTLRQSIREGGAEPDESLETSISMLDTLIHKLDGVAPEDISLFQNIEGLNQNHVGSASVAFLLMSDFLSRTDHDLEGILAWSEDMTAEQRAYYIAMALDLADEREPGQMPLEEFVGRILELNIPDASKVRILEMQKRFPELIREICQQVQALLDVMRQELPLIHQLSMGLEEKIRKTGCEEYLARTSRLVPSEKRQYYLRPFLMGMDTGLAMELEPGVFGVYCGILRQELLEMQTVQLPVQDRVYEALRLLGDRTRFELVCYLRDRSAYGQELSSKFGLSRNTIHHHMSKLSAVGLIQCTASGNRVYYTLDRNAVRSLLEQQEQLLL